MTGKSTDILIIGGGHAGLTLAAILAKQFDVTVVEPHGTAPTGARPDSRTLAMLAGSVNVFKSFGLWPAIARYGTPIWRTELSDLDGGVTYDAAELNGEPFGFGFGGDTLRAALDAAATCRFARHALTGISPAPAGISAHLSNGSTIHAKLLVGADGRASVVRKLAGIGCRSERYGQTALTCVIRHAKPHLHTVREFIRPQGPIALLPLDGNRCGVTWVESEDRAEQVFNADKEHLTDALDVYLQGSIGALDIEGAMARHPLGRLHADRYVAPRIALIGDAAHGVHPIHAQGFNMGVQDIDRLVKALSSHKSRRDPGTADPLIAYARDRRPANVSRLLMTDMLARILSSDAAPVRGARRVTFKTLSASRQLRRFAVRHGMQA